MKQDKNKARSSHTGGQSGLSLCATEMAETTEIKDEMKFWFDFLKLNFYIEKLKFDNAVYFILGTPLSRINTYIQNYMDDENVVSCGDAINRLFFIVQETINSKPGLFVVKRKPY